MSKYGWLNPMVTRRKSDRQRLAELGIRDPLRLEIGKAQRRPGCVVLRNCLDSEKLRIRVMTLKGYDVAQ